MKTHGISKASWNFVNFNTEISIRLQKTFADSMVKIIPDDKCKVNVDFLLYDGTYPFIYDVKTTEPE